MRRLPSFAFAALAIATVAAVFITQHLKVTTPFIAGQTYKNTPHWIVPANSKCDSVTLFFHLLHHADSFNLDIVDGHGRVVRTLAHDVRGAIKQPFRYSWTGRLGGGAIAPHGLYNFRLHLIHQNRTIDPVIPNYPISVQSTCPKHLRAP
jgi:flagellar hook assembly protein FlgD